MIRRGLRAGVVIAAGWVLWTVCRYYIDGERHRAESAWFILTAVALAAVAYSARAGRETDVRDTRLEPGRRARRQVALLSAVAASVVLYWPAVGIGLLSDDFVLLARPAAAVVDPLAWDHFRPLPLLVWKALYRLGGPAALHILNVTLHGLNAWLLWGLSIRLGHTPHTAALVGALFLFFPAAVEPIAWNSGIFDVAAVFFGLLHVRGAIASSGRAQALGVAALAAALLSKETAVVMPAIAVAVAVRTRINRPTLAISAALSVTYALARMLAGTVVSTALLPPGPFRYAAKEILVRPFASLGAPWTSAELRAQALLLGALPVAIVLLLIVAYAFRPRAGLRPVTGIVWVLLGIAPLAGIFFVNDALEGSRYLYLPLCGWSLFLGDLVDPRHPRRFGPVLATAMLMAVVAVGTFGVRRHLRPWQQAALLRNELMAEARMALLKTRCRTAAFEGVPELSQGSAQLFRNGFGEAVRDMEFRWEGAACRFVWTGRRFAPPD